jgi:cephalosporin-C deacetylase
VPQFDLPLDQLRAYRPDLPRPDDFDDFWAATLAEARGHPLDATFEPVDNGLAVIDTLDVTFRGFGGSPIRAWLHLPVSRSGPLPGVVEFGGYGSGRGLAHERTRTGTAPPRRRAS